MRMITACFAHALQRYMSCIFVHFLPTFQEVMPISKTRNQLTDIGGSVRMPAAHNALVGLRPTVGLVSRTGIVPLDGVRDTAGPMARNVTDMTILLDVIIGPDPDDTATARSAGHIPPSYLPFLKKDGLTMVRLGVLRQVFPPQVTDARIIAHFAQTLAELKAAGAEIVDPLVVPALDTIPRPPQTNAQFQTDLTAW